MRLWSVVVGCFLGFGRLQGWSFLVWVRGVAYVCPNCDEGGGAG